MFRTSWPRSLMLAAAALLGGLTPPFMLPFGVSSALAQESGGPEEPKIVEIGEERVTASRYEEDRDRSPGSVTVVHASELAGEMQTLPDMLERVPGLHVIRARGRGAYTVASVRGSTSSQATVYVDGVLANLESEAAVDLSAIPAGSVDRIEVYKGYIPSRFPRAGIGGVINVVTRKPDKPETTLSAGFGSFGAIEGGVSHAAPLGGGDLLAAFHYSGSKGDFPYRNDNGTPYNGEDDYDARRRDNGFDAADLLLKWEDAHWSARLAWTRMDRDLPSSAPGMDKPESPRSATLDTDKWEAAVSRRQKNGPVDWGWRLEYLRQDKLYRNPNNLLGGWGEQRNEYETRRVAAGADAAWAMGSRHYLEAGLAWSNETLDAEGDIVETFGGRSHFSRSVWRFALQDTIDLSGDGTLLLTPSIRWDSVDGEGDFSWAAALTKQMGPDWTLKASFGRYARAPNLYELYGDGAAIRPNRDLNWETGTQWDLGVLWNNFNHEGAAARYSLGLTYFGRRTGDMIEFVMADPRYGVYRNIAEAEVHGLELEGTAQWGPWSLALSATWMDARNRTGGDYREGSRLPNAPEWAAAARLTRALTDRKGTDRGSAFVEAQFTGDNYFDQDGLVLYDDLFLLNAGVKWKFCGNAELALGVNDILDNGPDVKLRAARNGPERMSWYPLAGRSLYVMLRWTF